MRKIAIVGGGILGLTLAYRLSKDGYNITIIEKANQLGGLVSTINFAGVDIENYYHHLFGGDKYIIDLISELGMSDDLLWLETKMGFFINDFTYNFSGPLDLLNFKPLSFVSRLRAGLISLYIQKTRYRDSYNDVTAFDWSNKFFGREVTNIIWKPLLESKFGNDFDKISMSWLFSRIKDRSTSRKSLFEKEKLGYLKGSFKKLIDRLIEKLNLAKVKIKLNYSIKEYKYISGRHYIDGEVYDDIVATIPPEYFVTIFNPPHKFKEDIKNIKYIGATCLILKLKVSLMRHYWTSIADTNFPFLAVVDHTQLINQYLEEKVTGSILYIGNYVDIKDDLYNIDKGSLVNRYVEYLKRINPEFSSDLIEDSYLVKAKFAQHIVNKSYKVLPYDTGIPGLYYANFAQIFPHDRGTNYAVEQANELYKILTSN